MQLNTLIQEAVWVTALSCFAALSISLPSATDPSLRSELALSEAKGVTLVGSNGRVHAVMLSAAKHLDVHLDEKLKVHHSCRALNKLY
jgi:hypothetical protein